MTTAVESIAAGALASLTLLTSGCTVADTSLRARLQAFATAQAPQTIAVAYATLPDGAPVELNGDRVFHAASTMKIAVMIQVMRRTSGPEMSLDHELTIRNEFRSIADGSTFELSADRDGDLGLYSRIGGSATVRELVRRMIQRSSNLATNLLVDLVTPAAIQATIESLGTTSMQVRRGVEDTAAFERGLNNTATARDLRILLSAIANDRAASPAACREMIEILCGQQFNGMIPAGLPAGTRVAHKTGEITRIHHDAAIVLPSNGDGYVLVVLTEGYDDPGESAAVIAQISALVWADQALAPSP